jgi:hypothetical protein
MDRYYNMYFLKTNNIFRKKKKLVLLGILLFILAQGNLVSIQGNIWGAEVISTESTGDSNFPSLAIDSPSNLHVVWHDTSDYANSGTDWDIFYKLAILDAIPQTVTITETKTTTNTQIQTFTQTGIIETTTKTESAPLAILPIITVLILADWVRKSHKKRR